VSGSATGDAAFAATPAPPYWAVVFTSRRTEADAGYAETAARMVELARRQPGFLGLESARGEDGVGITVSYWRDEAAIAAWKAQVEHAAARARAAAWYAGFAVRVCRVERAYGSAPAGGPAAG